MCVAATFAAEFPETVVVLEDMADPAPKKRQKKLKKSKKSAKTSKAPTGFLVI